MRSQHLRIIQRLLALCAAVSLSAAAQAAQPRPSTADAWRGFAEKLPSGAFVAVALTSGERLEGHVLQVSEIGRAHV